MNSLPLCPGILGICLAVLTAAAGARAADPPPASPLGCGKAHALQQKYLREQLRADWRAEYDALRAAGLREAFTDTDLLHCDLDLEIIPSQYDNLAGVNTMTIQSKVDGLTQFTFRLRSQYVISSIVANGATPVTFTTPSTTTRVVTLDRPYNTDEIFTLTIAYSGHAESRGFGSIEFTTHNTVDIVYTLSEAYFSYTWWPAKDGDFGEAGDNGDKFTLDLAVTAPNTMITASNGLLQGVDALSGNRSRYRWSSAYPIAPYLVCFSSTNYNTWQLDYTPLRGGTMPVLFYIYPEHDTTSNRNAWGAAVGMITTLRDLFGEYPFVDEKYGIYECQFSGGMEHQTFTAQGTFSEQVTVHELGHQWWGDMITCKTWNDIWLNEGFATYTEALWAEFKPGSSGLPALKATMAGKKYFGAGSVYVTNAELGNMSAIFDGNTTYNKAGWVLHMLRRVLGDADFFSALAAYRAAFEFQGATTADFQTVCESVYGGSLDWFFQQWVFGEYAPAYSFGWQNTSAGGQNYLELYVDQTHSAAQQRFTMPIDVVVNGTTYTIFNDHDPEHFLVPLPSPASTVALDPDEWVLASSRTNVAFVPGPPKIVAVSPDPGAALVEATSSSSVTITFHTPVSTSAADYALVGATSGARAFSFAYHGASRTTTLTTIAPLPADTYTLTVAAAVTSLASGQALDGEIADPADPASLPSGEGVAGGTAVFTFTVSAPLPGDIDGDGDIDLADWAEFAACLTGPDGGLLTGCNPANLDDDGDVDLADAEAFLRAFGP